MNKNNSDIPFSVIMPVYEGDVPSHFSDAIESVKISKPIISILIFSVLIS